MFGSKKSNKSVRRQPHNDKHTEQNKVAEEEDDEDDIFNGLAKELGVSGYEIMNHEITICDFTKSNLLRSQFATSNYDKI